MSYGKDLIPPPLSKSGVYLLQCRDCPSVYVGECRRAFRTRIEDHVHTYETRNHTKSAFARHLLQEEHTGDEEKILHFERNNTKRLVVENIEIVKHQVHHGYNVLNRTTYYDPLVKKVFRSSPHYVETEL